MGCLLSIAGCSLVEPGETGTLSVHLQSSFDHDRVEVQIDGRRVFKGQVTTDHRIGLADAIELQLVQGRHLLEVDVAGGASYRTTFTLDHQLFIGVEYFDDPPPTSGLPTGVRVYFSEVPFGYD